MKKIIKFEFGNQHLEISADEIIIPRIGEKVDIYNLIETPDERIEYNKFKKDGVLFVIDIFHDISQTEQVIEVTLSNDLDLKNDFYTTICNCAD
jgi:hypothetical protein